MTEPYAGADALTLYDVARAFPAMQAFLDFTGLTAEQAPARVLEIEGDPLAVEHVLIDTPVLRFDRTPSGNLMGMADVSCLFTAPIPEGLTDTEAHRWALGIMASLRRGIIDWAEQRLLSITTDPPMILEPTPDLPLSVEWRFNLVLEVVP
jgi:hypothetical protein